jgi:hypothetical protein
MGYPIMVGVMVGSGSQELIAKFGPIISTEALWHLWIIHGTDWLIISLLYWWYPMIESIFTTHRLLGATANHRSLISLNTCEMWAIDGTNWLIFE